MPAQSLAGKAVTGARIFDGEVWHDGKALVIGPDDRVAGIVEQSAIPASMERVVLDGGMLVPGFVDLQVNGGGGVLFNDRPDAEAIAAICAAHSRFGTTALLATLITDAPEVQTRALQAGVQAAAGKVPGFLGLHVEGPHISIARKGVHDPALIRPMEEDDVAALVKAAAMIPVLVTTVAPEAVTPDRVRQLTQGGVQVSLGHSDAGFAAARAAADSGARLVTHIFNAMSPLAHREPGMVGHALDDGRVHAGLIADGIHIDPVAIGVALRAKRGPGHIFLVTDAMATIGTGLASFTLNGRTVHRRGGRLTLADGTLAGADIDMLSSVRFMHETIGLPLGEALRMAALYPAEAIGKAGEIGHLMPGARVSAVHLTAELAVAAVWVDGHIAFEAREG